MNKSGLVVYAEPRFKVYPQLTPNDPGFGFQWQIPHVGADSVWSVSTGGTNTVVAVVDGGTNFNHPDLLGNIAYNYAEALGDEFSFLARAKGSWLGVAGGIDGDSP